jgi:hypothetical protein
MSYAAIAANYQAGLAVSAIRITLQRVCTASKFLVSACKQISTRKEHNKWTGNGK